MSRKKKKQKLQNITYRNQVIERENSLNPRIASWEKIITYASLLIYIVCIPPFLKDGVMAGHDSAAHMVRLRIFFDALSQGQFPVRWIEWVIPGNSQPFFSYYGPLLYYSASFFHFVGVSIASSLSLTVILSWFLSGMFVYLFVKNLVGRLGGTVAATLFVFAPYHILDIFVRAAYPEVLALAFIPALFWALERFLATEKHWYGVCFAVFLAMTALSHPPTLLQFCVPLAAFSAVFMFKNPKNILRKLIALTVFFVLGFGLAAFFLIPAWSQNFIQSVWLHNGYYDFHQHFACFTQLIWSNWTYGISVPGCNDQLSFQLGIINWTVLLSAAGIFTYEFFRKKKHESQRFLLLWFLLALFGMYLTLEISLPWWEGVPLFSFVQYPWRFLSIACFSSSILAGYLVAYFKPGIWRATLVAVLLILAPVLVISYLHPVTYLPNNYYGQDSTSFYNGTAVGQKDAQPEPGYFPKAMEALPKERSIPASEIGIDDQSGVVTVTKSDMAEKQATIETRNGTTVHFSIHNFAGWKFFVDGQQIEVSTDPLYDFVSFELRNGKHTVDAQFTDTPLVTVANIVTVVSFFLLLALLFLPKKILPYLFRT